MWKCLNCSEEIEDDYAVCWNCETGRDGTAPAARQSGISMEEPDAGRLTIMANLGHLEHTSYYTAIQRPQVGTAEWADKYKIHLVTLERPEKGYQTISIRCEFCGKQVPVKIASEVTATRKRLLSLAVVIALLIYMYLVYTNVRPGRITVLEGLLVTAAALSFFAVILNLKNVFKSEVDLALTVLNGGGEGPAYHKFFAPHR